MTQTLHIGGLSFISAFLQVVSMSTTELLPMRTRKLVKAQRAILDVQDVLLTERDREAIRSDFDVVGRDIERSISQYAEGLSGENRKKVSHLNDAI